MNPIPTEYKHIQLNDSSIPTIEGTTMKVSELVLSHLTYGWSPEELHFQYPHISLSKIYSALAYYWDHQSTIDNDLQQRWEQVKISRQAHPTSKIADTLRSESSDFRNEIQ